MKNGDVVFFKEAKETSHRRGKAVKFKGHAFGVMLGHVPPFAKDPPAEHLIRLMGTIGFVSFDDVGEILGDEQAQLLVKKFEDKYYGKEAQDRAPEVTAEDTAKPSLLLDASGQAIAKTPLQALPDIIEDDESEPNNELPN